ncbi:uncharacterized protein LOC105692665 isoform X1 [Athalia rosae]|uniref:uncharacterized protein LOC105692665 isoform X1 n=1 Tax=Athalia rosae TaxID=37344 RepID=UPI002033FCD1|nr:uncharacterized protein LOC105692665 isoform X1 [Athalia rosae]
MIFCLVILLEEVDVKILPNAVYLILRLLDLCTCNNRTVQAHGYTILHTYRSATQLQHQRLRGDSIQLFSLSAAGCGISAKIGAVAQEVSSIKDYYFSIKFTETSEIMIIFGIGY